jgi:N4-(beta-N-acetylglucosaminyl)-L-asparaginase
MYVCLQAVERIARRYPDFMGAVVAVNMKGEFGAACHGLGGLIKISN